MVRNRPIFLIAAADANNGIGKENDLPWRLKQELAFFTRTTTTTTDPTKQNMIVMGQNTWESLPAAFRPLPNRLNVVLTRDPDFTAPGAQIAFSFEDAYALADASIETIFIGGGASVYAQAIARDDTDGVYLTRIHHAYDCDTFFPEIPDTFSRISKLGQETEDGVSFTFSRYERADV